jgi:hypothetical protein
MGSSQSRDEKSSSSVLPTPGNVPGQMRGILSSVGLVLIITLVILVLYAVFKKKHKKGFVSLFSK